VLGLYLMWFAVLVSGVGAFGVGMVYAVRPTERGLLLMRPLSLASIFAAVGSLTAGWATVLEGAAATPAWNVAAIGQFLTGVSETLIPVFAAFGFLAVAWLLVAIGMRRQG
jgi:hypothetical protein